MATQPLIFGMLILFGFMFIDYQKFNVDFANRNMNNYGSNEENIVI